MHFDSRHFWLAKDSEHPQEYQDAFGADAAQGIAVIADGVSSAIFSAQWASILAEAVLADAPDPGNPDAFAHWLYQRRVEWNARIETASLAWFQRAKLPTGAFSTLLWLGVAPLDDPPPGAFGACRLGAYAIGDSCLFQVRGGDLVRTFPIQSSAEMEADPVVLGSVDLNRDSLLHFATLDELCYPDDLLILCTDALADWALRCYESGQPPHWRGYWDMSPEDWQAEVFWLRQERHMRYDDTTLLMLRVVDQHAAIAGHETAGRPQDAAAPGVPPAGEGDAAEAGGAFDWLADARKLKSVAEQIAEQSERTSEQVLRGIKSLKEKALQKYREKFGKKK